MKFVVPKYSAVPGVVPHTLNASDRFRMGIPPPGRKNPQIKKSKKHKKKKNKRS
jgi:hypothetical protein